jgi:hypothetical protein
MQVFHPALCDLPTFMKRFGSTVASEQHPNKVATPGRHQRCEAFAMMMTVAL